MFVPTWNYVVKINNNDIVELKPLCALSDEFPLPEINDKALIITGIANSSNNSKIFKFIPDNLALPDNKIVLDGFDKIAFSAISTGMQTPVSDPSEFRKNIENLNSGAYGFKRNIDIPNIDTKYKIHPVYKIELISEKKDDRIIEQKYNVLVGIKLLENDDTLSKKGLQQEVTIYVPEGDNDKIIDFELLKIIYPLLQQLATNLH